MKLEVGYIIEIDGIPGKQIVVASANIHGACYRFKTIFAHHQYGFDGMVDHVNPKEHQYHIIGVDIEDGDGRGVKECYVHVVGRCGLNKKVTVEYSYNIDSVEEVIPAPQFKKSENADAFMGQNTRRS